MRHPFRRWLHKDKDKTPSSLLARKDIERIIKNDDQLKKFFSERNHLLIFRNSPTLEDPVYEIQLTRDLNDRLETYAWLWIDALDGGIIKMLPED